MKKWLSLLAALALLMSVIVVSPAFASGDANNAGGLPVGPDSWGQAANYTKEEAAGGTRFTAGYPQGDGDRIMTYGTALDGSKKVSVTMKLEDYIPKVGGGNDNCFVLRMVKESELKAVYNASKLNFKIAIPEGAGNNTTYQPQGPGDILIWYTGDMTKATTYSIEPMQAYDLGEGKTGAGWVLSVDGKPVAAIPFSLVPANYFEGEKAYFQFTTHVPEWCNAAAPAESTPVVMTVSALDATVYGENAGMNIAAGQWTLGANYTAADTAEGTRIVSAYPQGDRVVTYNQPLNADEKISITMKLDQNPPQGAGQENVFVLQLLKKGEIGAAYNAAKFGVQITAPADDRLQAAAPGAILVWSEGSLTNENTFSFEKGSYNLGEEGKTGTGWIFSINGKQVAGVPYDLVPEDYFEGGEAYLQFSLHMPANLTGDPATSTPVTALISKIEASPLADPTVQDHSAKNWKPSDATKVTVTDKDGAAVFTDTLAQQDRANTFQPALDPTKEVSLTIQMDKALDAANYGQFFFLGLSKSNAVGAIEAYGPTFRFSNAQAEPAAVSPTGAPLSVTDPEEVAKYPSKWFLAETDQVNTYTLLQGAYNIDGKTGEGWILCINGEQVAAIPYEKIASNFFGDGPAYLYFGVQNAEHKPVTMTVTAVRGTAYTEPEAPDVPVDPDLPVLDDADKIDINADSFNTNTDITASDTEAGVQLSGMSQYDKTTALKLPINVKGEINIDIRFNKIPEGFQWVNFTVANSLSIQDVGTGFEGFGFFDGQAPKEGELVRYTIKIDEEGKNYLFLRNGVQISTSAVSAAEEKFLYEKGFLHICMGSGTGDIGTYTILELHASGWTEPEGDEFSYLGGAIPESAIKNYPEITDDPDLQTVKH